MNHDRDRIRAPRNAPQPSGPDDAQLGALLADALGERAAEAAPAPDALPRLNARLDRLQPDRPWWMGRLRWAGAIAIVLLLLAVATPVGRLAAAGFANATHAVVTTVKEIATGDGGGGKAPSAPATVPSTGSGSAVATAPTGSSTHPPGTGSAPVVATVPGTAIGTPRGTTTGTPTMTSTATTAPTATDPARVPGALTGGTATASPTGTPAAHGNDPPATGKGGSATEKGKEPEEETHSARASPPANGKERTVVPNPTKAQGPKEPTPKEATKPGPALDRGRN